MSTQKCKDCGADFSVPSWWQFLIFSLGVLVFATPNTAIVVFSSNIGAKLVCSVVALWCWGFFVYLLRFSLVGKFFYAFGKDGVMHTGHKSCPTPEEAKGLIVAERVGGLRTKGKIFHWGRRCESDAMRKYYPQFCWRIFSRPLRLVDFNGNSIPLILTDEFDKMLWGIEDYLNFSNVKSILIRAQLLGELAHSVQGAVDLARGQKGRTESKAAKEVREYLEKVLASRPQFQQ